MTKALSSMSAGRPSYDLVEVVDVLGAGRHHPHRPLADDEVHQVEEVARLLDQRAAGVGGEAVPVADLGEEREAVLAHRDHQRAPDGAGVDEADELGGRRHVAVLQADPRDRAGRAPRRRARSGAGSRRPSCTAASRPARAGRSRGRRRRCRCGCGSASRRPPRRTARWRAGRGGAANAATSAPAAAAARPQRRARRCRRSPSRRRRRTARMFWMCSMPIIPVPMTP